MLIATVHLDAGKPISVGQIIKILNGEDFDIKVNRLLPDRQKAAEGFGENIRRHFSQIYPNDRIICISANVFIKDRVSPKDDYYDILIFYHDGDNLYSVTSAYPLSETVQYVFVDEGTKSDPYFRGRVVAENEDRFMMLLSETHSRWAKPVAFEPAL